MKDIKSMFAQAVTDHSPQHEIVAYFAGGQEAVYTMNIFGLLRSDPQCVTIVDAQTGEVIFCR